MPSHQIESPVMKRKLIGGANELMRQMEREMDGEGNGNEHEW